MKKIIKSILLVVFLFLVISPIGVKAENKVNLYFFRGEGCPHCAKEEIALKELEIKYPNLKIYSYEVWYNQKNQKLLTQVGKLLKADVKGVPFTVIGNNSISGFSEQQTEMEIENYINYYTNHSYRDKVGELLGVVEKQINNNTNDNGLKQEIKTINLPIFGKIEVKNFSLPILTIIIGTIDGFNPCSMWVLLFLISMLFNMNNKKKMWALGLAFIITSAAIYFAFMAAWLKITLFIGALLWVRLLIASVAIISGVLNLKATLKTKDAGCSVADDKKRTKIFDRIKKFTHEQSFILALVGIILLAISVNFIELVCSAGLPVIYTQVLSYSHLSNIQNTGYLLLYDLFFMLDDIIIFTIAMTTFKLTGISNKYGKFSHIIGGIIMIIIGILLIIKPGLLMFG
jgi:thiol-disulfide isomerase/thioredoxin